MGHARVLKVAAYGTNGQVRKRKDKKQSYARVKTKTDGTSFLLQVIPSQNKIEVFTKCKKIVHTWASPTNLSFTYTDYFYSKFYCGRSVALADGVIDEDKGSSLSNGTTFGSVGGGMRLASNPVSTPSAG